MKSVLEIHAIEALERWHTQIFDLIDSGVFGAHKPSDCLFCRAQRIMESIQDLKDKMNPPTASDGWDAAVEEMTYRPDASDDCAALSGPVNHLVGQG
jgi:hypothetical protein